MNGEIRNKKNCAIIADGEKEEPKTDDDNWKSDKQRKRSYCCLAV